MYPDCGAVIVIHKSVGETAHLSLKNHTHLSALKWRKAKYLIAKIVDEKPDVKWMNKFTLNSSRGTLTVKNLTANDSGVYEAQIGDWEETVIIYYLKVHGKLKLCSPSTFHS